MTRQRTVLDCFAAVGADPSDRSPNSTGILLSKVQRNTLVKDLIDNGYLKIDTLIEFDWIKAVRIELEKLAIRVGFHEAKTIGSQLLLIADVKLGPSID